MATKLNSYDTFLSDGGPAALVIREHLMSVEGADGVLFPATFAASEDKTFKGGYNIDNLGNGKNVCLVDSVGSQANRLEPIFSTDPYKKLVPQVVVKAGPRGVNLLDAGHRAADAVIRCSTLQEELQAAFRAAMRGDAAPLAKIAPTSLVFGVWDSRDTQAKLPRLIASTIRAFNVQRLTRSAQYVPATEYIADELLEDTDDKKMKDAYSAKGFVHVPASATPGGVVAEAVRRDASLHLAALRLLGAGKDPEKSLALKRYVFGLALTAFTFSPAGYLRQGCNLVADPEKKRDFRVVFNDGRREPSGITHDDAISYAVLVAEAFGVGEDREVAFEVQRAKADLSGEKVKKPKSKGKP